MRKLTAGEMTAIRYAIVKGILEADPVCAAKVKILLTSAASHAIQDAAEEAKVPAKALIPWYGH